MRKNVLVDAKPSSRPNLCPAQDRVKGSDQMDVDRTDHAQSQGQEPGGSTRPDHAVRDMEDVDYNGRRQSVVAGC